MEKHQDKVESGDNQTGKRVEEIIRTFSGIDEKIMALHQCSSDDFLSLNNHLKKNYQSARKVSDNANQIVELVSGSGNEAIISDIELLGQEVKSMLVKLDESQMAAFQMVQRLAANLGLLFVPIKNFRQNLMSLKLLLTNLKLSNSYLTGSQKGFSEKEVEMLFLKIEKIKDSCPIIEENIFSLREHLSRLSENHKTELDKLIQYCNKDSDKVLSDFRVFAAHQKESRLMAPKMKEITDNCFRNVGSIITNLQYHDIIRQKMEHIQQTHHKIIDDLSKIDTEKNDKETLDKKHSFIIQIPEITEIQIAQLLHTNKEYQAAIEKITRKMIQMGKDMTEVSKLSFIWTGHEIEGELVLLPNIKSRFIKLIGQIQKFIDEFKIGYKEILSVNEVLKEISTKFLEVYDLDYEFEQLILEKFETSGLLNSPEKEISSMAQQVVKLQADNHFEKNKVRKIFLETLHINKELQTQIADYLFGGELYQQLRGMEQGGLGYYAKILSNQDQIEELQKENIDLSSNIAGLSKTAVEQVKYYDYFEKAIEEVIFELNSISSMLQGNQPGRDASDREATLRQIEAYYTMKSERLVHNMVMDKKMFGEPELNQGEENTDEGNDVEFF